MKLLTRNWIQTTAYALYDLCLHPEYVEPLRAELKSLDEYTRTMQGLPLLDSFIKESTRLNPMEASRCSYNRSMTQILTSASVWPSASPERFLFLRRYQGRERIVDVCPRKGDAQRCELLPRSK
jgi:cytochrome P450